MDRPLGRSNSREILCPLLSPQLDLFTPSFPIPHMSLWATGEDTTYKQPPAHVSPSLGYGVIPPTLQYYGVYPFWVRGIVLLSGGEWQEVKLFYLEQTRVIQAGGLIRFEYY